MLRPLFTLLLAFVFLGAAEYPRLFSRLGTPLYEADQAFMKIAKEVSLQTEIEAYHQYSEKSRLSGLVIESSELPEIDAIEAYHSSLRELQKKHDKVIASLQTRLLQAMDAGDHATFLLMVESRLDPLFEDRIMKERSVLFYTEHASSHENSYMQKMEAGLHEVPEKSSVAADTLVLLTASWCRACKRAKAYLSANNIAFTEYDIETNSKGMQLYKQYKGHAIPMMIIGDEHHTGFDPAWIEDRSAH